MADGYQPQLNPASGNQTSFDGAPGDWGAGLTQGLESAGNSMDSAIHQIKQKNRDADATSAGVQFAHDSAALDQQAVALRQQAGPGGAGHSDSVNTAIDQASAAALGNIRDPEIRRTFQVRYADLKDQLGTREYGWQAGKYVDKLATDFDQQGDVFARQAASTGDVHVLPNAMQSIQDTGHALALDDDTRTKLIREQQNKVAVAWGDAAARLNPRQLVGDPETGTKGMLDSPAFTQYFQDPKVIDFLRNKADVELSREAAQQRLAADQAKAAQEQKNGVFEYRVSSLGYVPTAPEWQDYISSNQKLGLVKPALEISDLKDRGDINQKYNGMPPIAWHNDIQALQQKVEGGTATDFDRMHLKNLIAQAPAAIDKFNADPQGFAATTPNPAPPIDLSSSDPASLQQQGAARTIWARKFAATNGIVNPATVLLSNDEKKLFGDGLKQGPAGQVETLQKMQSIFGAAVTSQLARTLVPGDKNLEFMSSLNGRGMELYSRGDNAVTNKIVHLGASSGPNIDADRQGINDALDFYAPAIPLDMQPAFRQVAEKIAAGVAFENGIHEPTGDDLKRIVGQAVQRIGGLQGSTASGQVTGGFANLGTKFGGDKNNIVWLPQSMTRSDFYGRLTRAAPQDWVNAGGQPYYVGPNGKPAPLNAVQMGQLRNYSIVPVHAGTGDYALADQNGHRLKQKDGLTDWQFNIRNLR